MHKKNSRVLLGFCFVTAVLLSSCAAKPINPPVFLDNDYANKVFDLIVVLPAINMSTNSSGIDIITDGLDSNIKSLLQKKNYRAELASETLYLNLNEIVNLIGKTTPATLASLPKQWINNLEPKYARWVFFSAIHDVAIHSSGQSVTVNVSSYLFDTQSGTLVWQGSEETAKEKSENLDLEYTAKSAVSQTVRDSIGSLPVWNRKSTNARSDNQKQSMALLPVNMGFYWKRNISGKELIDYLQERLKNDPGIELGISYYDESTIWNRPQLPKAIWTSSTRTTPNREYVFKLGNLLKVDSIMMWSAVGSRLDGFIIDIHNKLILHRSNNNGTMWASHFVKENAEEVLQQLLDDYFRLRSRQND